MIVGPPGTGKTDVAVQVIANLYHTHQTEKILIVTHSNAALNDLFEKIMTVRCMYVCMHWPHVCMYVCMHGNGLLVGFYFIERRCPPPPAASGYGRGRAAPGSRGRHRSGGGGGVQQAGQSQLESRPTNQAAGRGVQAGRITRYSCNTRIYIHTHTYTYKNFIDFGW